MSRCKYFLLAITVLNAPNGASARAGSIFGTLANLSQYYAELIDDDIYIINDTDRSVVFYVRQGNGNWIGSTGASPHSIATGIDGDVNVKSFDIKALVYNPKNGQWVDKTGWVRIANPDPHDNLHGNSGDDLYFEFFRNAKGVWKIQLL